MTGEFFIVKIETNLLKTQKAYNTKDSHDKFHLTGLKMRSQANFAVCILYNNYCNNNTHFSIFFVCL